MSEAQAECSLSSVLPFPVGADISKPRMLLAETTVDGLLLYSLLWWLCYEERFQMQIQ